MMSESETSIKLPVFDISQPLDSSSLSSLYQACKEWGFFHITNHGVPMEFFKKLHSLSNNLFNLPSESKLKVGPFSSIKTYTPHFIASPFFESLRVSGPDFYTSAQSSVQVLYGEPDSGFSEVLKEYGNKMTQLSETIIKSIITSLGEDLTTKFYDSEFSNNHGYLRINNYTPPEKTNTEKEVEGLGKHTDMSCITIVYQDEIGGLQVKSKKDDKWMDINYCEGTLLVNIGDLMQAWSNDKLRSSEHRVVLRNREVNRQSLAFFWCFGDDKVVSSPEEVVGEGEVRMYKEFVCEEYMKFRESNVKGRFEKVGFTVKDFAGVV